ncbi:MAG: molybdopterin molybdotransferase MoeA [Candidatus Eremiobacteraeota bacterium]|nr:molybdopterin molybdotransferase MoeA [Candidatus Eremiobacteraeota bacterium]MBV8282073.1 molybdopterin molybdotransferase MoeA [Candidatus Eremiobacteraeota bacterium]
MSAYPLRVAAVEPAAIGADLAGRVLAAPVHALEDAPPFTRSSVDGFAVRAADVAAAKSGNVVRLTVAGDVPMGAKPAQPLQPGHAVRVPTGGFLPAGATGVVKKEDCRDLGDAIEVVDGAGSEDHITHQGADVRRGDVLARAGDVLTPAAIGMLSGAGVARLELFAVPRVALLVTGDEIVSPAAALRPGAVRDINSLSLTAALRAMGFAPVNYERVADRKDVFAAAFARAFDECDAVVISGGSSVGERDYTPQIVAQAGEPGVIVHGVRAKPGRPTMLAVIGDKPVIGLPGNPVSALVMLETLGKPVLLRMYGKPNDALPYRARLRARLDLDSTLEHLVPVALSRGDDGLEAVPLLGTSSEMHILGHADALVSIPEGSGPVEAGSLVDAMPLSRMTSLR